MVDLKCRRTVYQLAQNYTKNHLLLKVERKIRLPIQHVHLKKLSKRYLCKIKLDKLTLCFDTAAKCTKEECKTSMFQ